MFQNKITQSILAIGVITLLVISFSCSPKAAGVRAQVKTGSQDLNPAVSVQAAQQAAAQGANYQIYSISIPTPVSGGNEVSFELRTPDGRYLPVTTQHVNGVLDTQGTYNDTVRNLVVTMQARCSTDACAKYTLLVTVSRASTKLFQTGAISYASDCKFAYASFANAANIHSSLTSFENAYRVEQVNDQGSCQ